MYYHSLKTITCDDASLGLALNNIRMPVRVASLVSCASLFSFGIFDKNAKETTTLIDV